MIFWPHLRGQRCMLAQNIMQYDHILKNVDFIQAYVTPAAGHFWPKGHNFNTFGRGDAT